MPDQSIIDTDMITTINNVVIVRGGIDSKGGAGRAGCAGCVGLYVVHFLLAVWVNRMSHPRVRSRMIGLCRTRGDGGLGKVMWGGWVVVFGWPDGRFCWMRGIVDTLLNASYVLVVVVCV